MTKAEALASNYNKKELAEKVVELSEKLEEMKSVEVQLTASVEGLKEGNLALGVVMQEDGKFQMVKVIYDLNKNSAAIVGLSELGADTQIAAGKLVKETGDIFLKASGNVYYK